MSGAVAAPLAPGLGRPVEDAQFVFRAVLEGMSFPGRIVGLPLGLEVPARLNATAGAVLLALADLDTPVWLAPDYATAEVKAWLAFHCGCPLTQDRGSAGFAVVTLEDDLYGFPIGSAESPEGAVTAVVPVPWLGHGNGLILSGPGIKGEADLAVPSLSAAMLARLADSRRLFPQGYDLILAAPERLACLPRTTKIQSRRA